MANKKISIKDRDIENKKSKKERDKVYHKVKASKLYGSALLTFITMLVLTIFSPMVVGKSYSDYSTINLNEPINIANSLFLKVSDMEINREKGLLKLTINYEDDSNSKSLSNIKYDYTLNYIENDTNKKLKMSVVDVSEDHTVVYYEGLPEDFGVISVTIKPSYIYPELETADDLVDKEIKFYAVDKDIKENKKLKIQSDKELKIEGVQYQIKKINDSIEEEKHNIELSNIAIELAKEDILSLENSLEIQTSEEKIETYNTISTKENAITLKEEEIEKSKINIEELNKKVDILKENIKKIK